MIARLVCIFCLASSVAFAQNETGMVLNSAIDDVEEKVIAWRRYIHQHPELSNREYETASLVAAHLESLGFDEIETGIAHTGVVGTLRGGQPGPTVALRADMDALPVKEMVDLPFASRVTAEYNGEQVSVMHACGHDNHVAILMGVAEVLAGVRDEIPGTVKFIFQPAEETAKGAREMVSAGALEGVSAILATHVDPHREIGRAHV